MTSPSNVPSPAWWALAARQLARDFRAGELRLLALAVMLAVAALTAVGFFADRLSSGLSRDARISADALALLLQRAWASPVMPEFMASLPISGSDGTLRRSTALSAAGRAHLKTGSLRDVVAVAGYLLAPDGRRYVLVAIINHPRAAAARPALDALVEWAMSARGQAVLGR